MEGVVETVVYFSYLHMIITIKSINFIIIYMTMYFILVYKLLDVLLEYFTVPLSIISASFLASCT